MMVPARFLSYGIDAVLFSSAFDAADDLPHGMFAHGWLITMLTLLVVYVLLGDFGPQHSVDELS